jgi:hypothetical protein
MTLGVCFNIARALNFLEMFAVYSVQNNKNVSNCSLSVEPLERSFKNIGCVEFFVSCQGKREEDQRQGSTISFFDSRKGAVCTQFQNSL